VPEDDLVAARDDRGEQEVGGAAIAKEQPGPGAVGGRVDGCLVLDIRGSLNVERAGAERWAAGRGRKRVSGRARS
jgi:hypothetical protein